MTGEAFTEAVTAMEPTLYRVACTILVQMSDREDAVQSAIELAWRKRHTLRDEGCFRAWLTRILIHECYGVLRKSRRALPVEHVPESPAPPDSNPDLYRFFTSLPDKLRVTMVLHYVEGYEVSEIAGMLHIPPGTVKSRLHRGREIMRQDRAFEEVEDL